MEQSEISKYQKFDNKTRKVTGNPILQIILIALVVICFIMVCYAVAKVNKLSKTIAGTA